MPASAETKTRRDRTVGRRLAALASLGAVALLAACGGRSATPVQQTSALDQLFTCAHLDAEIAANTLRMEDLRDERVANRLRNLTRVPGALFGNPLSALALADPSLAIYREIDALEKRNTHVSEMRVEKDCDGGGSDTLIASTLETLDSAPDGATTVAEDEGATPAAPETRVATAQPPAAQTPTTQALAHEAAAPAPNTRAASASAAGADAFTPDSAAISAYASLLQSGAAPEKPPLEDALAMRAGLDTRAIETATIREPDAKSIKELAEDVETIQRAEASPQPRKPTDVVAPRVNETIIPKTGG